MKVTYKLLIIAACFIPVQAFAIEKLSVSELLDKYATNQDRLASFIAKTEDVYCVQWSHKERPDFCRLTSEFRVDGKRTHLLYYTWDDLPAIDANTPIEDARYWADLWDGKCSILYTKRMSTDDKSVVISTEERLVKHNMVVWHGGLPLLGIRYSDYEPIDSVLRRANSISVRDELEQLGSADCYVIDANTTSGTYTVWLDPQHGYQIARADIRVGPNDLYRIRPLKDNESSSLSIRNIRFENIDGMWVPIEADIYGTSIKQRQDSSCKSTGHHKITQITINPDHEALGSFVPVVENGTEVYDRDSGAEYTWQDRMKFVVDEWDGGIRYVPKEWSLLVGVGKPLPQLEGIKLNLSSEQTKNRAILLCFFDMNQRPSRHCIRQLAQKAAALKEKGIIVAAVQTSQVTEKTLNEWIKKYNIPFPVGAITADIEKTSFSWGVRALPWLILTDRSHIVSGEGFGIDELDEETKKIIDTEQSIHKNEAMLSKSAVQTGLSDSAKSFLDAEAILAGWESSYAGIRTMRVSYCTRLVDYQPPACNPNEPPPVKYMHVERVEQGNRFHLRYSTAEDGFDRPESLMEHAFDGKITREYLARGKHGSIVAGLIGRNTETMNHLKVYMLLRRRLVGGRNASGTYLIEDPNSKPDLSRTLSYAIPRSMISVLPKLESAGSQLCHVIEVTVPGKDHKGIPRQIKQVFWMAHDKGMCLMKYQWYWDNTLDREIEVKQIGMAKMDGTDVWYPKKACRTIFSDEFGTTKYELTVTEFVPNVKVDENTFRFDFPKGTYVFDRVRGISGVDLPKEPPSLVGKSLPELKDLKVDLSPADANDKMMLVSFWDMEQRPSRNCIRELAKRAGELKEKGIIVAAVQTSQVTEKTLNEWIKKYNIPFSVGAITEDIEKTRFTWGVRSLPWLILTDKQHVVTAEGFTSAELNEKLGKNSKR